MRFLFGHAIFLGGGGGRDTDLESGFFCANSENLFCGFWAAPGGGALARAWIAAVLFTIRFHCVSCREARVWPDDGRSRRTVRRPVPRPATRIALRLTECRSLAPGRPGREGTIFFDQILDSTSPSLRLARRGHPSGSISFNGRPRRDAPAGGCFIWQFLRFATVLGANTSPEGARDGRVYTCCVST